MIQIKSQNGHTTYNLREFVIDKQAELSTLPLDTIIGSTCFCIENSTYYIKASMDENLPIDLIWLVDKSRGSTNTFSELIMTSPNGSKFKIAIDDNGNFLPPVPLSQ